MSTPTIEELAETFYQTAVWSGETNIRAGLLAVLDRLKPVVAEAYRAGWDVTDSNGRGADVCQAAYATRIIDQIKGEPAKRSGT